MTEISFIRRKTKKEKRKKYLTHYLSDKGFNGTVVNRTLPSFHGGSLEITLIDIKSLFYIIPDDPDKTWQFKDDKEMFLKT